MLLKIEDVLHPRQRSSAPDPPEAQECHKIHPILAGPPPLTAGRERITTQIVPPLLEYSRPTVIASEALLPVPPFSVADSSYIPFLDTLDMYPRK